MMFALEELVKELVIQLMNVKAEVKQFIAFCQKNPYFLIINEFNFMQFSGGNNGGTCAAGFGVCCVCKLNVFITLKMLL